jgi:hypothetical protein
MSDSLLNVGVIRLLFRREVVIGVAFFNQSPRGCPMLFIKSRLKERTFIGIKAEPVHAFQDALHHLDRRPLNVRVLDAEYESAVVLAREKPIEQRGPRAAQV